MWLFLAVPWVGLQCVIVVFPDHTHLEAITISDSLVVPVLPAKSDSDVMYCLQTLSKTLP